MSGRGEIYLIEKKRRGEKRRGGELRQFNSRYGLDNVFDVTYNSGSTISTTSIKREMRVILEILMVWLTIIRLKTCFFRSMFSHLFSFISLHR